MFRISLVQGVDTSAEHLICYFPSKIFFRKENIQFSSRRFFFLFLKLPMTRRVQVCRAFSTLVITNV